MDKVRPVVVVSADIGNKFSNSVVVAALTTTIKDKKYPVDVDLPAGDPLPEAGRVLCRSLYSLPKEDLAGHRADLSPEQIGEVDTALAIALSLPKPS